MKKRNLFIFAVLLPLVIDHVVTLYGQPPAYWVDYEQFNEGAMITLLGFGPTVFILGMIPYAAAVGLLLLKLPMKYALPLGIFAFLGHAWGSSSWIPGILYTNNIPANYWLITLIYFFILSILLAAGLKKLLKGAP